MCLDWSDLGLIPNSICSFAASESFDVGETYLTMKNPNLSRGCLKHSTSVHYRSKGNMYENKLKTSVCGCIMLTLDCYITHSSIKVSMSPFREKKAVAFHS